MLEELLVISKINVTEKIPHLEGKIRSIVEPRKDIRCRTLGKKVD